MVFFSEEFVRLRETVAVEEGTKMLHLWLKNYVHQLQQRHLYVAMRCSYGDFSQIAKRHETPDRAETRRYALIRISSHSSEANQRRNNKL
ncbi:hypothetical protein KIN20_021832 [Parelaphostrongylus tenuis]|uniref:Uncharacterized protein n=1 Tax=Parelaphostrongylus tenuis TaxID=148309 RepID=A0AAD5MPT2_PARTN|nr:hypothetical protein KIN20_021832 [Parelaphostrongylus tenuis]